MLRLDYGPNLATSARGKAGARRPRAGRARARAARPGFRAHPCDLRLAALPAPARELRHTPAHHPGATALAGHRGSALATPQAALSAAHDAPLPRARRGHAQELRLHPPED